MLPPGVPWLCQPPGQVSMASVPWCTGSGCLLEFTPEPHPACVFTREICSLSAACLKMTVWTILLLSQMLLPWQRPLTTSQRDFWGVRGLGPQRSGLLILGTATSLLSFLSLFCHVLQRERATGKCLEGPGHTGLRRCGMKLRRLRRAQAPPPGRTVCEECKLGSGETWQDDE